MSKEALQAQGFEPMPGTKGVFFKLEADIVYLAFDATKNFGPSASGKTIAVASTSGNKGIDTPVGEIKIGLNAYHY